MNEACLGGQPVWECEVCGRIERFVQLDERIHPTEYSVRMFVNICLFVYVVVIACAATVSHALKITFCHYLAGHFT